MGLHFCRRSLLVKMKAFILISLAVATRAIPAPLEYYGPNGAWNGTGKNHLLGMNHHPGTALYHHLGMKHLLGTGMNHHLGMSHHPGTALHHHLGMEHLLGTGMNHHL